MDTVCSYFSHIYSLNIYPKFIGAPWAETIRIAIAIGVAVRIHIAQVVVVQVAVRVNIAHVEIAIARVGVHITGCFTILLCPKLFCIFL